MSSNSSQGASQSSGPCITDNANSTQSQLNHRSIFQADDNSFFSSNNFQKVSSSVPTPPTTQSGMYII